MVIVAGVTPATTSLYVGGIIGTRRCAVLIDTGTKGQPLGIGRLRTTTGPATNVCQIAAVLVTIGSIAFS